MIELLEGLPDNVVGVEGVGEVAADDYKSVLVPAAEAALKRHERVRLLYVLGDRFDRVSAGAAWEDTKLGLAAGPATAELGVHSRPRVILAV